MVNKNNHVDELLKKYVNGEAIEETVDAFGKKVVESIHKAANERGYDSLEDLVDGEVRINTVATSKKPSLSSVEGCMSRYDYFIQSLDNVTYDSRYRGYYKTGHMAALERYIDKAELNRNNLQIVEKTLKQEISQVRQTQHPSLYTQGYLDGLRLVDKALSKSKNEMMKLVYDIVMDALK